MITNQENINRQASSANEDEIDLIALAKTIWDSRRFLIKTLIVFGCIGVAAAFFSSKEYTATTTMVPQLSDKSQRLGGMSSLAAMAGFNLDMDMKSSEISPYVYPQIVQSVPFQLELMNTSYYFSDIGRKVSLFEYYTTCYTPGIMQYIKKYTIGLPSVIIGAVGAKQKGPETSPLSGSDEPIRLTEEQEKVRKIVAANVSLETNDKEGYVTLSSRFAEPGVAAQVGRKAQVLLRQSITEFKIEKANAQLEFIEERYREKKKEFEQAQAVLAQFRDKNKNITSAMARTEEERLQSNYQLAFDVYSQLAQQLEQARIRVKEDTPVFSIIQPVTVPIEKSKPNRPLILIIWVFMGGVVSVAWIFGKEYLAGIKKEWHKEETENVKEKA